MTPEKIHITERVAVTAIFIPKFAISTWYYPFNYTPQVLFENWHPSLQFLAHPYEALGLLLFVWLDEMEIQRGRGKRIHVDREYLLYTIPECICLVNNEKFKCKWLIWSGMGTLTCKSVHHIRNDSSIYKRYIHSSINRVNQLSNSKYFIHRGMKKFLNRC
jgi:hypothetical protein